MPQKDQLSDNRVVPPSTNHLGSTEEGDSILIDLELIEFPQRNLQRRVTGCSRGSNLRLTTVSSVSLVTAIGE